MRASGAFALAIVCASVTGVAAYLLCNRLQIPAEPSSVKVAYGQHVFLSTRIVRIPGTVLETRSVRTSRGTVDVSWYDSAVTGARPLTGAYVSLYVDGHEVESTLIGATRRYAPIAPATLRWFGAVGAGTHAFSIMMTRVDLGFAVPFVRRGFAGIDSLLVRYQAG